MPTGESNPLAVLIGNNLAEVTFIRDYWQPVFFGMRLTIISDPQVEVDSVVYSVDTPGFRDARVGLITKSDGGSGDIPIASGEAIVGVVMELIRHNVGRQGQLCKEASTLSAWLGMPIKGAPARCAGQCCRLT